MDKFMKVLQKYLVPLGQKISKIKFLNAISAGLTISFPMIMLGCIVNIIANPPVTEQLLAGTGFISNFLRVWNNWATTYHDIIITPYNMTMGILGFIVVISTAYNYAKSLKLDPLMTSLMAMIVFLMVAAPMQDAVLYTEVANAFNNGSALDVINKVSMMAATFMGSTGMFGGLFVVFLSVNITKFCRDKNITFRMPDSIPPYVASSFSSIIPFALNVIILYGINVILLTFFKASLPALIMGIVMPVVDKITNPLIMFGLGLLSSCFWAIGIHGGLVNAPLIPIYIAGCLQNADLIAAGQAPVFQPIFMMTYGYAGGMGCMLALSIVLSRCKSVQLKTVGKMGLIPGFFGISEPVMFGTPVILNPMLALPMIISSAVVWILGYIGFSTGILSIPFAPILSNMPLGLGQLLSTNGITNFLFPYLGTIIAIFIYWPFVKVYDAQKLAEEQKTVNITKNN